MVRNTTLAALVALGLTGWGAGESFAQSPPQTYLRPQGLLVTQVIPGSTAAVQGIEVGDVIVSVDGAPVRSLNDLHYRIGRTGRVAELGVIDWRTGWENPVTVYPQWGRIGIDGRPVRLEDVRPIPPWDRDVRPIRPIYPPRDRGRPGALPLPGSASDGGLHALPLPGPGEVPQR
jgi:membrane-associated protease RseP (regulator of RpoE activity)